jgi:NAD(P)H dehydrogenase (quinone)
MTIAITGATGQLGRLVITALKQRVPASKIIGLARNPQSAAELGVTVRQADYDVTETLDAALAGVHTLLLISGNELGKRSAQHANVIAAAKRNQVKRIVYTSLLNAERSPLNLAPEHVETEQAIKASGIDWTILRNGWYTENYTSSIPAALNNGAFYGSAGNGRIASASRADYAQAAVEVLTGNGHEGQVYELAGDQSYTLTELAAELSRQSGKHVPYRDIPEADYAGALAAAGVPEGFAQAIASWDVGAAQDALFNDGKVLSKLIGRPTTPLAESVAQALRA